MSLSIILIGVCIISGIILSRRSKKNMEKDMEEYHKRVVESLDNDK